MIARILLALCSAVLLGAAAPFASASPSSGASCADAQRTLASVARAAAPQVFDDSTGETAGPDICGDNLVTNDNEGLITFGLHIPNRDAFSASDAYGVFLDTDLNPATGPSGAEWRVRIAGDGSAALSRWNGVDAFVPTEAALEPAVWVDGYGPAFRLRASDVDGAQRFSFLLFATDGANVDGAPNQGTWSYELTPLRLAVGRPTLDRPRSGKPFTARVVVTRSDFQMPLEEGAITCAAKVGVRRLAGTGRFAGGRVACSFRLPMNTRGKRVTGSISVTFQGVRATRAFTATVR